LLANPKSDEAKERIKAMVESSDGFHIAEVDLKLRGPGEVCGIRQSGLPHFRVADLVRDEKLLKIAREAAFQYLEQDPSLNENPKLLAALKGRYGKFLGY
jgi:ATP-dependent DNA helicase RecG